MIRIIAGEARGRRLLTPTGDLTRPTADRVKEALFSSLEARFGSLEGLRFLDAYAGSGAVGLEARSRGAGGVTLIERNAGTAGVIRANLRVLGFDAVTVVVAKAELVATQPPPGGPFDVAFFDPPYSLASAALGRLLTDLLAAGWFGPGAELVVERDRHDEQWAWPTGVEAVQSKRYGETVLWYGRVA